MMPPLCPDHQAVYATRLEVLKHAVRHPGQGRKRLAKEAAHIARQCPRCCVAS